MSSRFRILQRIFCQLRVRYRYVSSVKVNKLPLTRNALPATVGFSLFTWLGFEKKLSAEDELINTIKHCVLFIQRNELDKAEQLLHVALRQAQQTRHEQAITYIYDVMANLALQREQLEKAKKLFVEVSQRLLRDGADQDDPRMVHISIKLARIHHLKKDFSMAQLGYDWCIEKLTNKLSQEPDKEIFSKLLAMTEDWYGRLFLDGEKHELALRYMVNSLDRMKKVSDVEEEHIVIQLNDIGTVYDQIGKYDESIAYFKEAIELGTKLNMDEMGIFYVNLGRAYLKKNMIADARKNCGFAWKLGVTKNIDAVKDEAEDCLQEIKLIKPTA